MQKKRKLIKNNNRTVITQDNSIFELSIMSLVDQEQLHYLAKKVKELRLKKGVSQEAAYNDTGVHFGRIEQGKRDISYLTICKVINYFDCKAEVLFKG